MWKRAFGALILALNCNSECVQVGPPQFGELETIVMTSAGDQIEKPNIRISELGTGKVERPDHLPYGYYRLQVTVPGFKTYEAEISVGLPRTSVRVSLDVAMECRGGELIAGSVRSVPPNHELWVKAVQAYGIAGGESRVDRNGNFQIAGLGYGPYVVMVMDGSSVLHSETARVPFGNGRLLIDLRR